MKLLTFLGLGKYETTTYVWDGKEYTTSYSPIATCHFLQPDEMIVFLTEDAEQKIFPDFRSSVPISTSIQAVSVPLGRDEQELWQIFDRVSGAVPAGEEPAFDITHGLRSFPLVGLLVAAFLRTGLNIRLKAVLYGAFDVGKAISPGRTPMIDLSPMLALLEWAAAADRFNRTGDSRYLASLVKSQRKSLALASHEDPRLLREAGHLGNLAGALESISQGLALIRPYGTMQDIAGLEGLIHKARPALERAAPARPFSLLLESVSETYLPLAQEQPAAQENIQATLQTELTMIRWYAGHEHWVQAVSLAREWLLSWIMVQIGVLQLTSSEARHRIENVVGAEATDFRNARAAGREYAPIFLGQVPQLETILALWLRLGDTRNDIDHAGMRDDPKSPVDLIKGVQDCIEALESLPL